MRKPSKAQIEKYIPYALAGVGILMLVKSVGRSLGLGPDEQPDPLLPGGLDPGTVTVPPTLTAEHARVLAETIYVALYGDGTLWSGNATEDEQVVIGALAQCRNDADVLLLIDRYGNRSGLFALTGSMGLIAALREYLSARDIEEVNATWRTAGIRIQL